jgi:lysine-ketoglutarate reductase/saccharopine dehydrogenase-like protein (TIGR00300 family)
MSPDFLVIGAGVAGMRAAIELAEAGTVLVVAKDSLRESSSEYAQGGIAVALGDDDEVPLHEQDTLYAGDGLCDNAAVHALVSEGPGAIEQLIEWGYVDLLFTGNALAVHDIENALFGTSLGIFLEQGALADAGHENHMRAINAIRGAGGIAAAVERGILQRGIMYKCVQHGVDFVLAGSIRDDGPLPDVITDAIEAQQAMRAKIGGVSIALMMATMLHSIAVGNLLPATVKTLYVDINPGVIAKLTDRGTFQAVGLVTDIEPFLRELTGCIAGSESSEQSQKRDGQSAIR